jgi:putative nucleotidyltransferase with HDIG domain
MKKSSPLKRSIRRLLFYRLGITVLGVTLIFAALSLYHSKKMIKDAVIQASTIHIDFMRGRLKELMQRPGANLQASLQDAVNYPPDTAIQLKEGSFIYARLHNAKRSSRGEYLSNSCPDIEALKAYLTQTPAVYPRYGELKYSSFRIGKQSYLDIHSRLTEGDDNSALYLRAIFVLSKESSALIRRQALQLVLSIVTVVLLTALLLYPVIVRLTNKLADFSTGLLCAQLDTMEALGVAIAKRDSDTDIHNYRVTFYAVAMGEKLAMDEKQMQCLIKGAFLHDVGKIGIRDNILLNTARLDEREFAIMKKHVQYGLEIIKESSWLQDARDVVGSHHEKYDGSGYPAGTEGEDIPINARIFAIVDVFDALTSKRPYKEPYSYTETMDIMEAERSSHFDPALLDLFQNLARQLYDEYSGREDHDLKHHFQDITTKYFHSGLSTLQY